MSHFPEVAPGADDAAVLAEALEVALAAELETVGAGEFARRCARRSAIAQQEQASAGWRHLTVWHPGPHGSAEAVSLERLRGDVSAQLCGRTHSRTATSDYTAVAVLGPGADEVVDALAALAAALCPHWRVTFTVP